MSVGVPGQAGAISIEVGNNHGTLIVGHHNVVNLAGVAMPVLQPRVPADVHRPVEPEGFLDRRVETAQALAKLQPGSVVQVRGEPRIGKSFLLRHAATAAASSFADGALLLPPGLAGARDVLQSLFEMFWLSTPDSAPSTTRLRELLAGKRALIAIDHSELSEQDLAMVFDAARGCSLLVAGAGPLLASAAAAIELRGLPADDAMQLWERTRGATLDPAHAAEALARIEALAGHPQRLIEAARAGDAARLVPESLDADHRAVIETLRAFAPRPVARSLIAELSGVPAAAAIAHRLTVQGLVQAQPENGDELLTVTPDDERDRSPLRAAGLVRLGELATANPAKRRQALRALPLLWAALAHAGTQPGMVIALGRAWHTPLTLTGRWDGWGRLLDGVLEAARASGDVASESWALHQAGTRCLGIGEHERALSLFQQSLQLRGGDSALQAATQHHLDLLARLFPSMPPPPPPPPAPSLPRRKWLKPAAIAGAMGVGSAGAWWLLGAPRLEWSAARVEFDPAVLGQAGSQRKALTLRNTGWRSAQLTGLQADPPFSVDSDCGARPLAGGASCEVHVGFAPMQRGEASGRLVAAAQGIAPLVVPLAGRTLAADLAHATQIDFGAMDVGGAPLLRSLVVRNEGDAPARAAAGSLPPPFAVLRDGCKGKPLVPGTECNIELRLRADAAGPLAATLPLRTDLPGQAERRVALRGEGRLAAIELAAPQLEFGATEVGMRSATQALRIRNGGTASLKPSAALAGNGEPFVVTPGSCQAPVPPGQSCELYLAFAPRQRGPAQAQLQVTAPNLPPSAVRLAGMATAAVPSLTPTVLDFGAVAWPANRTAPAERQLRLANEGDAPLRQLDVSVSTPQFRVVGNDCPQALPPGANCRLTLRFDPNAGGRSFAGVLRVSSGNASSASATAQLSAATRLAALGAPMLREPADRAVIDCGNQRVYPVTFRWQAPQAAADLSYRVEFLPGNAVDARGTSLPRNFVCPTKVSWRVIALAPDGRRSESESRTLSIQRIESSLPVKETAPPPVVTKPQPVQKIPDKERTKDVLVKPPPPQVN